MEKPPLKKDSVVPSDPLVVLDFHLALFFLERYFDHQEILVLKRVSKRWEAMCNEAEQHKSDKLFARFPLKREGDEVVSLGTFHMRFKTPGFYRGWSLMSEDRFFVIGLRPSPSYNQNEVLSEDKILYIYPVREGNNEPLLKFEECVGHDISHYILVG